MTTVINEQYFTEAEAQALKRKLVQAKTSDLSVARDVDLLKPTKQFL
jgi:hypothetical protein